MNTTILSLILVRGIGIGAVFALLAMSLNIVFRASSIINFATGHLFVLGGLLAFLLLPGHATVQTWTLLFAVATGLMVLVLVVQGVVTLAPLKSSVEQHSWLITTMAVSMMIGSLLLLSQGPNARPVANLMPPVRMFGVSTPLAYLLAIGLALLWFVGLKLFLRFTRTGLAVDALSQDLEAAKAAGLPVRRLQLWAFAVSGMILGSAGFVAAPVIAIAPDTGISYVLNGFIAAVVGGFGNLNGALVGGALLGITTMAIAFLFGSDLQNTVCLFILVCFLMLRPQGLFGRPAARRV